LSKEHSFISFALKNYFFGAMGDILPAAVAAAIDSVHDPASESLWAVFGRSEAGEMAVLASGEGDAGWREALPADAVQCGFFVFVFVFFVFLAFGAFFLASFSVICSEMDAGRVLVLPPLLNTVHKHTADVSS
jgi:hypothetical protein